MRVIVSSYLAPGVRKGRGLVVEEASLSGGVGLVGGFRG